MGEGGEGAVRKDRLACVLIAFLLIVTAAAAENPDNSVVVVDGTLPSTPKASISPSPESEEAHASETPAITPEPTPAATEVPQGWQPCDFDDVLLERLLISQRDPRYNTEEYYFFNDRFVISGCGPASIVNGMNVAFGISDQELTDRILLEIMNLNAGKKKPAKTNLTFTHMDLLAGDLGSDYPALTEMKRQVDQVVWVEKSLTSKKLLKAVKAAKGSAVIFGRINLSESWYEIIDTADTLHAMGLDDAVITITRLSAGTDTTGTPFSMGENGHFITICLQVGEFLEHGFLYVLDSYPRAVRGESLGDEYDKKYYFAANNKLTSFRTNYYAYHLSPMVVKCVPREEAAEELASLRAAAGKGKKEASAYRVFRKRLASRISTYGYGTLFLRIR